MMKLYYLAVSLIVFGSNLHAADQSKIGNSKEEIKKLEDGAWVTTSSVVNGTNVPEERITGDSRIVFKGNKFFIYGKNGEVIAESSIKIDPTKTPGIIDIQLEKGTGEWKQYEGKKSLAIYELTGDKLKICWTLFVAERDRPTSFESAPDSGLMLVTYKRVKK